MDWASHSPEPSCSCRWTRHRPTQDFYHRRSASSLLRCDADAHWARGNIGAYAPKPGDYFFITVAGPDANPDNPPLLFANFVVTTEAAQRPHRDAGHRLRTGRRHTKERSKPPWRRITSAWKPSAGQW